MVERIQSSPSDRPADENEHSASPETDIDQQLLNEAVERASPALISLAKELAWDIYEKEWDVVLGDDASGRLPALFVGRLINLWRQDQGLPPSNRIFIGGGRVPDEALVDRSETPTGLRHYDEIIGKIALKRQAIDQTVGDLLPDEAKRVLIVTDVIETGATLSRLGRALHARDIGFDVATVEAIDEDMVEERLREGGLEDADMQVYIGHLLRLGGEPVFKPGARNPHRQALRNSYGIRRSDDDSATVIPDLEANRELMRSARDKLNALADSCYERYFVEEGDPPEEDDVSDVEY